MQFAIFKPFPVNFALSVAKSARLDFSEKNSLQMGFRLCFVISAILVAIDIVFTSVRSTWLSGGDMALFVLLTVHEVVCIAMGVMIFAFFSNTIWFTAGLLGELGYTIKVTFPLWICRIFFVQMAYMYRRFISSSVRAWDDGVFGFLFIADIVSCIMFNVSFFFTMCAMSEKRMYAPYHREWQEETLRQEKLRRTNPGVQQQSGSRSVAMEMTAPPPLPPPPMMFPQQQQQQYVNHPMMPFANRDVNREYR